MMVKVAVGSIGFAAISPLGYGILTKQSFSGIFVPKLEFGNKIYIEKNKRIEYWNVGVKKFGECITPNMVYTVIHLILLLFIELFIF